MNFASTMDRQSFIPALNERYVKNGHYEDVKKILNNDKTFIPVLLTGPTGAGKTEMVEQINQSLNKPQVRVNITIQEDEDSLMGGFRLKNGETVFHKGPVIMAMELGATLLLDELDLGDPRKVMCLQSILEGKGYLIKKTGEYIKPAKGFKIVATANTKGSGDESGQYVGAQVLNGAMMDRFTLVFDCEYPSKSVETEILQKVLKSIDHTLPSDEIKVLVDWAAGLRKDKTNDFDLEYTISTRRLINIVEVDKIYGDIEKSLTMCLNRFDGHHKEAFLNAYKALKPGTTQAAPNPDDIFGKNNIFRI